MGKTFMWLESPLHKNSFSSEIINNESFDANFMTTMDGSVLAVEKSLIDKHSTDESKMVRLGMAEMPKIKVKTIDDLYKYISYLKFED